MHLRHTVAVLAIVATACSTTSSPSATDTPSTSGPLSVAAAPPPTSLSVDGPTPVPLPDTALPYAPIRSSRASSGNLAEQPISNGGTFAPPISFLADPESIRIDLAIISGDLYISVASVTDSVLTRAMLTKDGIALNTAVQWAGVGPDPMFGSVDDNVGFVDLPDRTAQTGAVPFGDGWAWVTGEDIVAIGTPNDYSKTPVNLLDDTLLATDGAFIVAITDPVSRLNHGIVGDLDGDGRWEVLVPNQRRNTLVALSLEGGNFQEDFTLVVPDGARFESNIAVIDWGDRTVIAIVTVDGVAAIWMARG